MQRDPDRTYKRIELLFIKTFSLRKGSAQSECQAFWKSIKVKPQHEFTKLYDEKVHNLTSKTSGKTLANFFAPDAAKQKIPENLGESSESPVVAVQDPEPVEPSEEQSDETFEVGSDEAEIAVEVLKVFSRVFISKF